MKDKILFAKQLSLQLNFYQLSMDNRFVHPQELVVVH